MGTQRRVGLLAVAIVALVVLADPVLAQSTNHGAISNLNYKLAYLAVPITAAVEVILIYTVYRYRNNDDPEPRRENRRLEITWTVATALVLLFVGAASLVVLANPYVSPSVGAHGGHANAHQQQLQGAIEPPPGSNATVVNVTGYQWGWQFSYPGTNVTTHGRLVLPANTSIYLHLSSVDVIHSFYSPKLDFKQDAFPGQVTTIRTNVSEPGTYQAYCAEFCGAGHSRMRAKIVVMPRDRYRSWLANRSASNATRTE